MKRCLLFIAVLLSVNAQAQINLLYDIWQGAGNSYPGYFTVFNNALYFSANDSTHGDELWKYTGSGNPTLVYDLNPGVASGVINYDSSQNFAGTFPVYNGKMYFAGNNGSTGFELYQYDGSSAPSMVTDITGDATSSYPEGFLVFNSKLYFIATTAANGTELYSYDGTSVSRLTDINAGSASSLLYSAFTNTGLIAFNNKIYFTATNGSSGYELYAYDPSNNTSGMVADIYSGTNSSEPSGYYVLNGSLYFNANDGSHGEELYKYTGSGSPTRLTDITAGAGNGLVGQAPVWFDNYLVFDGGDTSTTGYELYKLDTATNTTSLVYDINPGKPSSDPLNFTQYGNKLYFAAEDPTHGYEVWRWDGTNPPELIEDLNPGTGEGAGANLTVWNGVMYMWADNGVTGYELYEYTDPNLSIRSVTAGVDVNAYPVPTSSVSNISFSNTQVMTLRISVSDVDGKEMYHSDAESYDIGQHNIVVDMQTWPAGNYFYHLNNGKGSMVAAGKLVRQ